MDSAEWTAYDVVMAKNLHQKKQMSRDELVKQEVMLPVETNHELAETCIERKKRIAELEKENALLKSLLYGTQRSCDNCGFINCENFQRQRKSEPCSLYIPYQVRIKNLAHESDVLRESYNNSVMNLASVSEQLTKAKELLEDLVKFQPYINKEMIFHSIGNEWKTAIYKAKQFLNSEVEHD